MTNMNLKYLHTFRDSMGIFRCYVRRAGSKKIPIPGKLGSRKFMAAYHAAMQQTAESPKPRRRDLHKGPCIYFIRGGDLIKIGRTNDLRGRLSNLQIGSPTPLEVLLVLADTGPLEKVLHRRFAKARAHGEWFRAEKKLLEYIDRERMEAEQ